MKFNILTLFPGLILPFKEEGVLGRSIKKGILRVNVTDIREFARGKHKITDDRPFGGGSGMVMMAGPIDRALKSLGHTENSIIILLSPQGKKFDQPMAWDLAKYDQITLICGRYEGVDERVITQNVDMELSVGDYILSGGELGALIVIDAVSRLVPGVLGCDNSNKEDSFEGGLLEHPQYTRPRIYNGEEVPEILISGDHEKIKKWRREQSLKRTYAKRPDLLDKASLSEEDKKYLSKLKG
ncbi:MAG: tRNA (guanosine(37)-N1)-methyltransferase TrmD [Desulfatiglans sp.]|jgi:tRNA (guanine37-N1)-methyltransferase|nr:tRNA (guanosine(37)-N1)-methyltransferase TrmD [Desulfatiglans sp.]